MITTKTIKKSFNSTTTPLGVGGTYAAPSKDVFAYRKIIGTIKTDQNGTLYIEQSPDGTNWDVSDSIAITGGTGVGFTVPIVGYRARIRYVNGAVAQTYLRLFTYLEP
jgi:hypothetical protein